MAECVDNADEENCEDREEAECGTNMFECEDGECIPVTLRCDFRSDCADASDEEDCRTYFVFMLVLLKSEFLY